MINDVTPCVLFHVPLAAVRHPLTEYLNSVAPWEESMLFQMI